MRTLTSESTTQAPTDKNNMLTKPCLPWWLARHALFGETSFGERNCNAISLISPDSCAFQMECEKVSHSRRSLRHSAELRRSRPGCWLCIAVRNGWVRGCRGSSPHTHTDLSPVDNKTGRPLMKITKRLLSHRPVCCVLPSLCGRYYTPYDMRVGVA